MIRYEYSKRVYLIILVILLFMIVSCSDNNIKFSAVTLDGTYYKRDRHESYDIFLSSLKEGFRLRYGSERGVIYNDPDNIDWLFEPEESTSFCYLFKGKNLIKVINSLNDLKGYVNIESEDEAIEYVRLPTNEYTYYLFRPEVMVELFSEDIKGTDEISMGKCTLSFFKRHNLKNIECIKRKEYFEIRRFILECPWPGAEVDSKVAIYQIIEKVYFDGQYEKEKRKKILEWLGDSIEGIEYYPMAPL